MASSIFYSIVKENIVRIEVVSWEYAKLHQRAKQVILPTLCLCGSSELDQKNEFGNSALHQSDSSILQFVYIFPNLIISTYI